MGDGLFALLGYCLGIAVTDKHAVGIVHQGLFRSLAGSLEELGGLFLYPYLVLGIRVHLPENKCIVPFVLGLLGRIEQDGPTAAALGVCVSANSDLEVRYQLGHPA